MLISVEIAVPSVDISTPMNAMGVWLDQEPIGSGVKDQAELVGAPAVARGAMSGS